MLSVWTLCTGIHYCKLTHNYVIYRYSHSYIPMIIRRINREIVMQLHEKGEVAPSLTTLCGMEVIRAGMLFGVNMCGNSVMKYYNSS